MLPVDSFINHSAFPTSWKKARIVPIGKIIKPTEKSDFRPISILPVLSKVFERLVANQVIDFIESMHIYKNTVGGFRKGFCTGNSLLKIRDDIRRAMKYGELSLLVFVDFSKAFDTIAHDTLIKKMYQQGFSKDFLSWTTSYLTSRRQYVQVDAKSSSILPTTFGVPQGSILGPMIFNLYVNDLQDHVSSSSVQYADDTTIYEACKPNDLENAQSLLNNSLRKVNEWSDQNSLAANAIKTKYLLCASKRLYDYHNVKEKEISLILGSTELQLDKEPRYLGIYFDQHLDWEKHVKHVLSTCYGKLSVLRKMKNFTSFSARKMLAQSLILPKIDFNDYVYSPFTQCQLKKPQRLQKAAASFVLKRYAHTEDIWKIGWLPIAKRREFNILKLAFKAINNKNWPEMDKLDIQTCNRTLRNSNEIRLRPSMIRNTLQDAAANSFNALPSNIKQQTNFNKFCTDVKTFLMKKAKDKDCQN